MEKNQKHVLKNPRENANIFSILTFSWLKEIFRLGFTRKLEKNDIYSVLHRHSSEALGDRIFKMWDEKTKLKNSEANKCPKLMKILAGCFGKEFFFNLLILVIGKTILRTIEPFLLVKVLSFFNSKDNILKSEAYYWVSALLVLKILISVFVHQFYMNQANLAIKVRVACSSLVYGKILRLSKSSLENETSVGQVVNLLSHDVRMLQLLAVFVYYFLHCPLQIIIFSMVIYWKLGLVPISGILIILCVIPVQGYVGKWVGNLMEKCVISSDKRLSLMSEIINGIQVIKMYTWEKPFSELVIKARKKEASEIKKMFVAGSTVQALKIYITQICIFTTILTSIAFETTIATESVYMLISFYTQIREDFCYCFTHALQVLNKSMVSARRIENFLNREENKVCLTNSSNKGEESASSIKLSKVSAKASPDSKEMIIKNMDLILRCGQFTAIIGPVGSGKSSLLKIILKELPLFSGKLEVTGKVSYAAQEPWVFSSSIKQNILFGQPFKEERYKNVIEYCQLKQDMRLFKHGDETLIGEKGIKLSGGQRARINLARAVYAEADIYIFDDPLSAVDNNVGRGIFEKCMCRFLKDKTRILVTHQLQYLQDVDHIVILKDGSLDKEGSYAQIRESDLHTVKILQISNQENHEKTNEKVLDTQISEDCLLLENEVHLEEQEVSELRNVAKYSKGVFWSYLKGVRNFWILLLTVVLGFTYQSILTGNDYVLSQWMNAEDVARTNISINNTVLENFEHQRMWYIEIYGVFLVSVAFFVSAFCFVFFEMCLRATQGLHESMFFRVIRAPMMFFHENPSGRIMNRFSKDMNTVDKELPEYMEDIAHVILQLLAVIIIVILYSPWCLLLALIIAITCYLLRKIYVKTSHSLKHLEAASRSPIFNHVNATIDGLITIRAQNATDILIAEFNSIQDHYTSAQYLFLSAERCFGFYTELIVLLFVLSLVYLLITFNDNLLVGDAGFVILQSFQMSADLQWAMLQTAELQNQLTSVERILEYADVDQEPSFETTPENKPPVGWPSSGHVKFTNLCLSYRPQGTLILKNLNFEILPKEKIGIVGRTGAGKTSLIAALFRLGYTEGNIYIDDVETSGIGLHDLRSKISIIPQQPVFFAGSLRRNLDPFDDHPDEKLWEAIERVQLKKVVMKKLGALGSEMSDGGSNFSVGERQLLSLARAVLRNNKILVLDEVTANVDLETDELIQNTIRKRFRDCTVFIIAHRLNTVMDCDKFIIMDQGRIVEFGHPHMLLQNHEGHLYKMVQQTAMADILKNAAEMNYRDRIVQGNDR